MSGAISRSAVWASPQALHVQCRESAASECRRNSDGQIGRCQQRRKLKTEYAQRLGVRDKSC
jgi:hypothetical protein